jgi:hypothetical protein
VLVNFFWQYFSIIVSSSSPVFLLNLENLIVPSITDNESLCVVLDIDEITDFVFVMNSSKSAGPSGMSPLFFKTYWNVIKKILSCCPGFL